MRWFTRLGQKQKRSDRLAPRRPNQRVCRLPGGGAYRDRVFYRRIARAIFASPNCSTPQRIKAIISGQRTTSTSASATLNNNGRLPEERGDKTIWNMLSTQNLVVASVSTFSSFAEPQQVRCAWISPRADDLSPRRLCNAALSKSLCSVYPVFALLASKWRIIKFICMEGFVNTPGHHYATNAAAANSFHSTDDKLRFKQSIEKCVASSVTVTITPIR